MARGNHVVRPRTLREEKGQRAEQARALLAQLHPYLIAAFAIPIVVALYWAQTVLIPVAVAMLLSFVLGPAVRALQRTGLGSTRAGRVLSVILVVMLIEQRDLRNRLIRLTGSSRLTGITRALGDANNRITRYVLVQTLINLGYGLAVGLGLYAIGIPYVVLWGFLAFAFRFVPYIGTLMAALAPVAVSLAVFPGWPRPLLTVGLFLVAEALTYVVVEPLLYRQALGLSQTALLIAIAFWTWLWGPIGLLLATPLTDCLVVLGKHVPTLGFLTILMADDQPVLRGDISYYQRLLARDEAEANDIVRAYAERHPAEDVCDDILLPALSHAKRDHDMKQLTNDEVEAVYHGARQTIAELVAAPLCS